MKHQVGMVFWRKKDGLNNGQPPIANEQLQLWRDSARGAMAISPDRFQNGKKMAGLATWRTGDGKGMKRSKFNVVASGLQLAARCWIIWYLLYRHCSILFGPGMNVHNMFITIVVWCVSMDWNYQRCVQRWIKSVWTLKDGPFWRFDHRKFHSAMIIEMQR